MSRSKSATIVTPAVDSINPPDNGTFEEVRAWLRCTVGYLRNAVRTKQITPIVLGQRPTFPKEEVLRFRSELAQKQGVMSAVR